MMPRIARILLLASFAVLCALPAQAQCSPTTGLTSTCQAGTSVSTINSTINTLSNNAVMTLKPGTYTGSISLDPRDGFTLICETAPLSVGAATANSCNLTRVQDWASTSKTNLMRVSGFQISSANSNSAFNLVNGDLGWARFRVDHNTFNVPASSSTTVEIGNLSGTRRKFGVFDHNYFTGTTYDFMFLIDGAGVNDWVTGLQGGSQNIFIEDNEFSFTQTGIGSGMDAWFGGSVVVRKNTSHNWRVGTHGACHSGPSNLEVYQNTIDNPQGPGGDAGYRDVHHQGSGEFMVFDNVVGPTNASNMEFLDYRSYYPGYECAHPSFGDNPCDGTKMQDGNRTGEFGYPCFYQPGRDVNMTLRPIYAWLNRGLTGTKVDLVFAGPGCSSGPCNNYAPYHIVTDRDWFLSASLTEQTSSSSPFNGTSGVGHGILSRRPMTCANNSPSADAGEGGVGYWATDVGVWNRRLATASGLLYTCSTDDTWTPYYTPYTYPHPEVGGDGTPAAPASARVN